MTSFLVWWTLTTTVLVTAGVVALIVLVEPRRAHRIESDLRIPRDDQRR